MKKKPEELALLLPPPAAAVALHQGCCRYEKAEEKKAFDRDISKEEKDERHVVDVSPSSSLTGLHLTAGNSQTTLASVQVGR